MLCDVWRRKKVFTAIFDKILSPVSKILPDSLRRPLGKISPHFETVSKHFANLSKFVKLIVSNLNANPAMKIFVFITIGHHG